jgi:hypothetical protein
MQRENIFSKVATVKHRLQMLKVYCFAKHTAPLPFLLQMPAVPPHAGTAYRMLRQR